MFYVVTVMAWLIAMVAVTEFAIVGVRRTTDRPRRRPYGCC
jgi:hypothetical protein